MSVPGLVSANASRWLTAPRRTFAAVSRVGRRLSRASVLAWDAAHLGAERVGDDLLDPQVAATRMAWLAENLCAVHGIRIDVTGELPRGPAVLVANHVSYFDPMVLLALMPACPIAKRELGGWPVVGAALRGMGVTLVRRGDPYDGARALRRAMHTLACGTNVLVFPEGTTSTGERVLPLCRGIFGIARRLGVPVVPIALRYGAPVPAWVGDDWFLPHYARALGRPTVSVHVHVGAPMISAEPARDFARIVRGRLQSALDTLDVGPTLLHAA